MYSLRDTSKQKILLEQDKNIFRTSDLAVLWNIEKKNTLYTTVKRYVNRNILYRIQKGLYSTMPITKLHPYELGCAIAGPLSYVSTETVLSNQGVIMQEVRQITLVGRKSKEFDLNDNSYICRYLNEEFLVNRIGIDTKDSYSISTKERAVADLHHFNPKYFFDNQEAINKEKLEKIKSEIGYA